VGRTAEVFIEKILIYYHMYQKCKFGVTSRIGFPILPTYYRPAMEYLNKIRSSVAAQVHSVAAQVNLALPGNPIFREFQG
jgi:hypothetical protein